MTAIANEFVIRRNIQRYQELLETATDEPQRAVILRLLGEEMLKLTNVENARNQPGDHAPPLQAEAPADPQPPASPGGPVLDRVK